MTRAAASLFDRLVRARAALARARESGADPWRVAELQAKHDALAEAAADAGPALDLARHPVPAPRRPEPPVPLAWCDESGRPRRGPKGEPS